MAASGVLSSWLMLATNCDLCWLAISSSRLFLGDLLEQPRVLDGDDGLVGEGLDQLDLSLGEWLDLAAGEDDDADNGVLAQQWHAEHGSSVVSLRTYWQHRNVRDRPAISWTCTGRRSDCDPTGNRTSTGPRRACANCCIEFDWRTPSTATSRYVPSSSLKILARSASA